MLVQSFVSYARRFQLAASFEFSPASPCPHAPPPVPLVLLAYRCIFTLVHKEHKDYFGLSKTDMGKKGSLYSIEACEWGDTYLDLRVTSLPLHWSVTRLPDLSMVFSRDDRGASVKVRSPRSHVFGADGRVVPVCACCSTAEVAMFAVFSTRLNAWSHIDSSFVSFLFCLTSYERFPVFVVLRGMVQVTVEKPDLSGRGSVRVTFNGINVIGHKALSTVGGHVCNKLDLDLVRTK